jgi:arsenic resistance protein ArsH
MSDNGADSALPNLSHQHLEIPNHGKLVVTPAEHRPRILILYGSLRERSCSPERHGAMSGVMKSMIDWIPLSLGAVRPTQGKTLAVMQVSGGSQSFNAVNQMRVLGRWMRMITIPNQSSVAKAFQEFDDTGRMKPSAYYDRVVDVMEELIKFTLLTRDRAGYLVDRYSERKESAEELSRRVNLPSAVASKES